MKLIPIPKEKYDEYRLSLMFHCYKWDPQFLDHNTIAKYALVITKEEHEELIRLTENLDRETREAEEFLNHHLELSKPLALPKSVSKEIEKMKNYEPDKHIRLMRYDFHPTTERKWAVSEVNSDVPGGFAEGSLMPKLALEIFREGAKQPEGLVPEEDLKQPEDLTPGESKHLEGLWYQDFSESMVSAIRKKVPKNGRIMMVHCTCYSDDRQVMQFLGDRLEKEGFQIIYAAADHVNFKDNQAFSVLDGNEGKVDAIFRFTPLEWLTEIKPKRWEGYFDTTTVSCNHPVAIFAQTKRFPLIWDVLEQKGLDLSTWRELLPETLEVKDVKVKAAQIKIKEAQKGNFEEKDASCESYIYKPACGRVGEKISIKESCTENEYKQILEDVKKHPKKYLAQKRFHSRPLKGTNGEQFHVCLGSYTVDGQHAGYYARISDTPRIDSNAADIPVLISGGDGYEEVKGEFGAEGLMAKEAYKIWAPTGKRWVDWVRPVPFMAISEWNQMHLTPDFSIPAADCIGADVLADFADAAIIMDLPGLESIKEGIALAKAGYRPIPIFNGTIEQTQARATVDNSTVGLGLFLGAKELSKIEIKDDALPVFLVDSNRMNRFKMDISLFDNSWDVYPQDLPSAEFFLKHKITKIVIVSDLVSKDLKKVLYDFQKKKIEIFWMKRYGTPKKVKIHKPLRKEKD